jgi:ribosomal protein S27E
MDKDFIRCLGCGHGTDIKPEEGFIDLGIVHGVKHNAPESQVFKQVACPKCGTLKILGVSS